MRKQQARVASALLFTFSLGSVIPVHAEGSGVNQPLSENCRRAAESSGTYSTSVSKILCQEERTNDDVFGSLLRVTNNLTGRKLNNLDEEPPPAPPPLVERPPSIAPPKPVKENPRLHRGDNKDFGTSDKAHTQGQGRGQAANKPQPRHAKSAPSAADIREKYMMDHDLSDLARAERRLLRRRLAALLNEEVVWVVLNAIEKGEGGGLLIIVGGTSGKSKQCRELIGHLDTSGHPKEQGLPNKCFLYTRYGLSTAAGKYQIVYYRNWRRLRDLLGLKDFSAKSQAIAALELMRTSQVPGGKPGEGFIALVQSDISRAIRKGTDPWASSPYSRWKGKNPAPLLQYARQERKKMGREKVARQKSERCVCANNS
jgi:muramidase (phage lysozyme)